MIKYEIKTYALIRLIVFNIITAFTFSANADTLAHSYIFCNDCSRHYKPTSSLNDQQQALLGQLVAFEEGLNVYSPEKSRISFKIMGAGSTTLGLRITGLESYHVRRLAGFPSLEAANKHIELINEYRMRLHSIGIATTETQLLAVESPQNTLEHWASYTKPGVVYVVQKYMTHNLAKNYLEQANSIMALTLFKKQLAIVEKILTFNKNRTTDRIVLDPVVSNWEMHFQPNGEFELRLNDLAQPLFEEGAQQVYTWEDQASTVIWPFTGQVLDELKFNFSKLMIPRELLTQVLWGYERLDPSFEQTYPNATVFDYETIASLDPQCVLKGTCSKENNYPYPAWAIYFANKALEPFDRKVLLGRDVYKTLVTNNYGLACLNMIKRYTSTLRWTKGFLFSDVHIRKPLTTSMDIYGNKTAGFFQCLWDSSTAPDDWF